MNILVDIRSQQHFFQVSGPHANIRELVDQIHAVLCIAPECQQLFFSGAPVDTDKTFSEYGMKDESLVFVRVLAGAFDELLLQIRDRRENYQGGEGGGDGGDGGGMTMQEAFEAIRTVHEQTVALHERVCGVSSVKQYRYKAVYSCESNVWDFDVRETVLESDVGAVLSAFNKPTPQQQQQQQQQQGQQQQQQPSVDRRVEGFWDDLEPVADILNHQLRLSIESWQDLLRVSEACCASAGDYAQKAEYLSAKAVDVLVRGHLQVCVSVHRRLLRVHAAVQPETSRLSSLQALRASAVAQLCGLQRAGVYFEDVIPKPPPPPPPKPFEGSMILTTTAVPAMAPSAAATRASAAAVGAVGQGLDMAQQLCDWLPEGRTGKQAGGPLPRLLYRGSRDGLTGEAFHRLCDDQGATLTVVRSKDGYVFGGYASVSWKSSNGTYSADASAFMFTLTNPVNQPAKYMSVANTPHAIYCKPTYGPTFGGGFCLYLFGNGGKPYTSFPSTSYVDTTGRGYATFTGEYYFEIDEVEVWKV